MASLEEDLDITEQKMVIAVGKLDKAGTAADDSERAKKVFQSKAEDDDRRINQLEKDLKDAREKAESADTTYDEVAKKLQGDGDGEEEDDDNDDSGDVEEDDDNDDSDDDEEEDDNDDCDDEEEDDDNDDSDDDVDCSSLRE